MRRIIPSVYSTGIYEVGILKNYYYCMPGTWYIITVESVSTARESASPKMVNTKCRRPLCGLFFRFTLRVFFAPPSFSSSCAQAL